MMTCNSLPDGSGYFVLQLSEVFTFYYLVVLDDQFVDSVARKGQNSKFELTL